MQHSTHDTNSLWKYKSVKVSLKFVSVTVIYVRKAMFTGGKDRFCIPGLCGGGKTHRDTFWIHKKHTLIWTQKRLKTGQK